MTTLHLTLKKKWFEMILSGEKKEEYREIKPYWSSRLRDKGYCLKEFDLICFKNGYQRDAPTIYVECKGIQIRPGKSEWGATPGTNYYVIRLGKITVPREVIFNIK